MRRILCVLICFILILSLCACTKSDSNIDNNIDCDTNMAEEQTESAKRIATTVAEYTLHYRIYDLIPLQAISLDDLMAQFSDDLGWVDAIEEDGVYFDGVCFDSYSDLCRDIQQQREISYDNYSLSISNFEMTDDISAVIDKAIEAEYYPKTDPDKVEIIKSQFGKLYKFPDADKGAIIDFDITCEQNEKSYSATMTVYLICLNNEWKCISPTIIGIPAGLGGPFTRYIKVEY